MWGNMAVTQAYLTLSEVLGHVDLLVREGRTVETERDGVGGLRVGLTAPLAAAAKSPCSRVSSPSSGWKATASMSPWRAATAWPSTSARISTPRPCSLIQGARMKIAAHRAAVDAPRRRGPPRSCGSGDRTRCARRDVHQREVLAVEHDQPGAGAEYGVPRRRRARAAAPPAPRARSPASSSSTRRPESRARRCPRGRAARRTSRVCAPTSPEHRAHGPRNPPCSASTPISGSAPSARYQPRCARSCSPASLELSRLSIAGPRPRDACGDALGVLPVRGRLDDRASPRRRVLGLEDARADEDAFGAERHHQRGVGRRGDSAGAEQHDRQAPVARDLADQVQRRRELLGGGRELSRRRASAAGGFRR